MSAGRGGHGLGVRWTIGAASDDGFETLQCSLWGARRIFGADVDYTVCVNAIGLAEARARTGVVPDEVTWRAASRSEIPAFVAGRLDRAMAEGVAWKFAPLRLFPGRHELALDNDCILWSMPPALSAWLEMRDACLIAEDVRVCFGQFAELCGDAARNSGIRGVPPHFDLAAAMRRTLEARPVVLRSELDEQGLQVAAVSSARRLLVVGLDAVTICSPFPPHLPHLGECGAHFVGVNARRFGWQHEGRDGAEWVHEHWRSCRDDVRRLVGGLR